MVKVNKDVNDTEKDEKADLNYNSLIKKISENGDLCVLGMKGTCKTTLLMHLARTIREDSKNRLIIFETFPKWIKEFDKIPYMTIKDSDVQPKENLPFLEEDKSYIQWSKDFTISNAQAITEFLKENKDSIFLIECEDMEKISAFMTFIIYTVYRKQYLRAKAGTLKTVNENFWFLAEEAHNLMDSTVLAKKTFNRLRKMQAEFRNLSMHLICVTLRLQSLSPKIRSTMSILCSRVSLDDYQLKVRSLLRNSEFRDIVCELPKGTFIFPELDLKLTTEPFKQNGLPYEVKIKIPEPIKPKESKLKKFIDWIVYFPLKTPTQQQAQRANSEESEEDKEDSQGDGLMCEGDIMFPEEF
jgi:hypothetical protein